MWEYNILEKLKSIGKQNVLEAPVVLDLGGGAGEFSEALNEMGITCVSLDMQDWETNPSAKQVNASAYQMPFRDKSFDLVHLRGVLDTCLYPHNFAALRTEIARVLKDGGILAIHDDNDNQEDAAFHRDFIDLIPKTTSYRYSSIWEKPPTSST